MPVNRGRLLQNETVYQEFYEICMICLYRSKTHFLQIWKKSQFRLQSYEPLLESVSVNAEHVINNFAVFSKRVGQMF